MLTVERQIVWAWSQIAIGITMLIAALICIVVGGALGLWVVAGVAFLALFIAALLILRGSSVISRILQSE